MHRAVYGEGLPYTNPCLLCAFHSSCISARLPTCKLSKHQPFESFMEFALLSHDRLNYWPVVIDSVSRPSPIPRALKSEDVGLNVPTLSSHGWVMCKAITWWALQPGPILRCGPKVTSLTRKRQFGCSPTRVPRVLGVFCQRQGWRPNIYIYYKSQYCRIWEGSWRKVQESMGCHLWWGPQGFHTVMPAFAGPLVNQSFIVPSIFWLLWLLAPSKISTAYLWKRTHLSRFLGWQFALWL